MKIRKAVIPAAGFGTRFLPWTKAMPKEMLPIVDKPVIQHVIEEAVAAGIEDIIIVTGWNKRAIEDHFDYPFELIHRLEAAGKEKELEDVKKAAEMANFIYVRQKGPQGNATAIYSAKQVIGNEPFMVLWGDDFIQAEPSRATQLIQAYETYQSSILCSLKRPSDADSKRYGYIAGTQVAHNIYEVSDVIEKPGPENMPSDLAIMSGYIFTPEIFDAIDHLYANKLTGAGGEYVYTDALNVLRDRGQKVHALDVGNGVFYDSGTKLDYMKTVVSLGMKHPQIGEDFKNWLDTLHS